MTNTETQQKHMIIRTTRQRDEKYRNTHTYKIINKRTNNKRKDKENKHLETNKSKATPPQQHNNTTEIEP